MKRSAQLLARHGAWEATGIDFALVYELCVHTSFGRADRKCQEALMRKALITAMTGHRSQGVSPLAHFLFTPPRPAPCPLQLSRLLSTWSPHSGLEQGQEAPGQSRLLTSLCFVPLGFSGGRACGPASPPRTFTSPSQVSRSPLCARPRCPQVLPSSVVEMGAVRAPPGLPKAPWSCSHLLFSKATPPRDPP